MNRIGVLLLLLIVALLTACGGGETSVFDLEVGDCYNDPEDGSNQVAELATVSCDEPHDNEVFAVINHPAGEGEAFPGTEELDLFAEEECVPPFEEYVGRDYLESELFLYSIKPTEETWARGDREVVCALYAVDEEGNTVETDGSMRGSGR
jgi:hypothetical protein